MEKADIGSKYKLSDIERVLLNEEGSIFFTEETYSQHRKNSKLPSEVRRVGFGYKKSDLILRGERKSCYLILSINDFGFSCGEEYYPQLHEARYISHVIGEMNEQQIREYCYNETRMEWKNHQDWINKMNMKNDSQ